MAVIHIDNKPYEVEEGGNLLTVCLSLGFNIPYFCWHPALNSVGSCRLCAVKQFRSEKDTRGQIIMSCVTPAEDGMRISTDDPEVKEFRASVIQWLMINHPHDCPVCDEGGECHLQDMTVMTGHNYRKYRFKKRTHRNQNLGPFLNHEMNRCISCYRCVRYYRDYAGGRDFNVFGVHDRLYFGRCQDGPLENEFSGNLVEICPTGVFTDKTFRRHFTRKWDLQTAPSVCVHCGLGCNTIPSERYGMLRRIQNRFNHDVNGYFLCDRGRFGYEFVNSYQRLRTPILRSSEGKLEPVEASEALQEVADIVTGSNRVIGIGSPRASVESNYALRLLAGKENFCTGMTQRELELVSTAISILRQDLGQVRSLLEAEMSDATLVLGEDVTNTAPRLALSLRQSVRCQPMSVAGRLGIPEWNDRAVRQAVQDEKGPLFVVTTAATPLDDVACKTFHAAPEDIARLGFAIAHELDPDAPGAEDLSGGPRALAAEIAQSLRSAKRPLVVSGTGSGSDSVMKAAANIATALRKLGLDAGLVLTVPECNSLGMGLMGGMSLDEAMDQATDGKAVTVIIAENDLFRRCPQLTVERFLANGAKVIVIDHLLNRTASRADIALPAATFAEAMGTFVSSEGRGQRFFRVFQPAGDIKETWKWAAEIMAATGRKEANILERFDAMADSCSKDIPEFRELAAIAPAADFRPGGRKIPRQFHRSSGRTAMVANNTVHEPKPPDDPDSPLAFSMEGYQGSPGPALTSRIWAPGWNSIQSLNKFQSEVGGQLRGGESGLRMLRKARDASTGYFSDIPAAFDTRSDQWLLVPLHHILGSEEMSAFSPAIAERAAKPYIALNSADAEKLGLNAEDLAYVSLDGLSVTLPVKIIPSLPDGVAGMPQGLSGMECVDVPAWATVSKTGNKEP